MLDKVTYVDNGDGTISKTVTHQENITSGKYGGEVIVLQAQLDAFAIGRSSDSKVQADIDQTISSYQTAIVAINNAATAAGVTIK